MEEKTGYDVLLEEIKNDDLVYGKERKERESKIKNLKLRRKNTKKSVLKVSISTGILALVTIGGCKLFEEKPIEVVATELISDAKLNETDNGKTISGKMTEQELLDYIEEHDLSLDDIREETISSLKARRIDAEFGMEKVERENPAVFEEESKSMSK